VIGESPLLLGVKERVPSDFLPVEGQRIHTILAV
jgi:hypothetical protein